MKRSQKLSMIFLSLLVLMAVTPVFSQATQNEKRLSDAAAGYSFAVPAGFDFKQSEEGFGLVNTKKTVIVAVKNHEFKTFEEFFAQSNMEKDGFALVGKVQDFGKKGKTFLAAKENAQGVLLVDTFVTFSDFGGGALIVAFSDRENNQKGFQSALQIAESMIFTKPRTSAAASQWQTALKGKHLLYLYTASGFSERTDIYLCSSGAFIYRSDSSSLSSGGSGVIGDSSDGDWKISPAGGGRLELRSRNGNVRQFKITRRESAGEINLNNNRYFVQNQTVCR